MTIVNSPCEELQAENEELRLRLEEAEETLSAIGRGEVDAFVVSGVDGDQVFTLKGAEQSYRILVERMAEGAVILNLDGTIIYCNASLATMLQIPLEKFIGTRLGSYVAPADKHLFSVRLSAHTWEHDKDEITLKTGKGDSVPVMISYCGVESSGSPGIGVIVTDLSQQKRNEEFMAAEQLARSVIEQAGEAIFVCDEKGRIIRASGIACLLYPKSLLLKQFDKLFALRINKTGRLFSMPPLLSSKYVRNIEVAFKHHDGRTLCFLLNVSPLKSVQDQPIGFIVTLTDITKLKAAEADLIRSRTESEQRVQERTAELLDSNIALKVVLKKREEDREILADRVLANSTILIGPFLDRLKECRLTEQQQVLVDILRANIKELTSPFTTNFSTKLVRLTPAEIQIANLVKLGKRTKEIADIMHLSPGTISIHRKNIRKKLDLTHQKTNLQTILSIN
jgi:PAS domain-containing protein/DNA-binding CsgD family transcriptional regulator